MKVAKLRFSGSNTFHLLSENDVILGALTFNIIESTITYTPTPGLGNSIAKAGADLIQGLQMLSYLFEKVDE